ncbi:MAG: M28 family peptidase [Muribaculaceae bacterium]|nr:M28 family peptidase [Muribaculaceae bacterium]
MRSYSIALLALGLFTYSCNAGSKESKSDTDSIQPTTLQKAVFNADSAYSYVKSQVEIGPRVPGSWEHDRCAKYLVSELKRHKADTVIEQIATVKAYTGDILPINNIMGRYNLPINKRVLLVAHWDTRPWADNEAKMQDRERPVPGANDGASGVGVLLEVARQLSIRKPDIGIDILFTDAEDYGRTEGWGSSEETWALGAQHWVKNMPYGKGQYPVYGILLDMVGGLDARFHREYFSEQYAPAILDKVWSIANASGYGQIFINKPAGGITDDHIFINRAGIPCIDIIECLNPVTKSFPPTWHTLSDDMSSIDRNSLKAVGQTVLNTIYNEPAQ